MTNEQIIGIVNKALEEQIALDEKWDEIEYSHGAEIMRQLYGEFKKIIDKESE